MRNYRLKIVAVAAAAALSIVACQKGETSSTGTGTTGTTAPGAAAVRLQGAGSTFDTPLFSKVFDAYQKKGGAEVNYQSIGSGGGVQQLTAGTVDFGASDFPLNDEQTKKAAAAGGPVVHVPVTMGGVDRLQPSGRRSEARWRDDQRHLSGKDHEVERPEDRGAESRCEASGHGRHGRASRRG